MNKPKLVYVLLYPILITFLTALIDRAIFDLGLFSPFLQIENSIYDLFQKNTAIDRKSDKAYKKYQSSLDRFYCINLDQEFINQQSGRVKKDSLVVLLKLLEQEGKPDVIFLDYLHNFAQERMLNQELNEQLAKLDSIIVLPYEINFESSTINQMKNLKKVESKHKDLIFKGEHNGFLPNMGLLNENKHRYYLYDLEDPNHNSIVQQIIKVDPNYKVTTINKETRPFFEINYLLRNNDNSLVYIDASRMIQNWREGVGNINKATNRKIVIIGIFTEQYDHYGNSIDLHSTPIKEELNGIYIILNSYLNVLHNNYFKRASLIVIYLTNLVLALIVIWYTNIIENSKYGVKPIALGFLEIPVNLLFFLIMLYCSYSWFSVEFPFVISVLAFLRSQQILNYISILSPKKDYEVN